MLEHDISVGAELELELPVSPYYHSKNAYVYIESRLLCDKEYPILNLGKFKYDRTVNCGFEYATLPLKSKNLVENGREEIKNIFSIFGRYKTTTGNHVGMHVHVNKNILNHEETEKLNYFVYRNSDFCKMIGERDFNEYCRLVENSDVEISINSWAFGYKNDGRYIADVTNKKNHKHRMLNVARPNTIEFRFFKSTNNYKVFLKNMQFVIALVNFVKTSKSSLDTFRVGGATMISTCDGICYDVESGLDIIVPEFCNYIKKHKKTYKHFYNFLATRNWFKSRLNQKIGI